MARFEAWDVVKVPFPYTNHPAQQFRPALVVGQPSGVGMPDLLWVVMVTSAAHRAWPGDVTVSDLAASGLGAPSVVRSAKIATVEASAAQRVGFLPEHDRVSVATHLRQVLSATLRT